MANKRLRLDEQITVTSKVSKQSSYALTESTKKGKKQLVLMPRIEAIHAGMTKNKVMYTAQGLSGSIDDHSGVHSWSYPYPKPVLKNHDTDVEPLGRITNAQFVADSVSGKSGIIVIPTITDQDAIEKIMDGRYLTVSIGAETDSAVCSICGTDVVSQGSCGHYRGEKYEVDGELRECYWIAGNIWFHELSFVNIPADQNAQVIATGETVVMECYVSDGDNVFDIQKDKLTALTQEQMDLDGLHIHRITTTEEVRKGGIRVPTMTIEELQVKVTQFEADLQIANDKLRESVELIEKKDAEVEKLVGEVATLTASAEVLTKQNKEMAQTKSELDTTVEQLNQDKESLKVEADTAKAEAQQATTENATLHAEIHKNLAERVVDLKRSLGKPGLDNIEEAVQEHVGRSMQSLKDSLIDLLAESKAKPVTVQPVANPAAQNQKDKPSQQAKGKEKTEITAEQVVYTLLNKSIM